MNHKWNQDCWEKYQQPKICRLYHPYGRKQRGTKEPLDEGERGEWKSCLKLSIQISKIMASSPITSWQMAGKTVEIMIAFIFLDLKITADGDCSHKTKRCLLLGRKAVKSRQCIKKQRHYFANKGPSSQSYGFSSSHVWVWELDHKEGWVPKNWCCWTVVLEKTLESPLLQGDQTSQFLKEISPEYSLEGLMLKLKVWFFGYLLQRADSLETSWCWERLKVGGEGDDRGWDGWMASPTQWTWV